MTVETIHIHLDEAYWCENCQCIITHPKVCPSCATELNIQAMSKLLKEHTEPLTKLIDKPWKPIMRKDEAQ
jgi:uncharacterized paraquat-inducible protein A